MTAGATATAAGLKTRPPNGRGNDDGDGNDIVDNRRMGG